MTGRTNKIVKAVAVAVAVPTAFLVGYQGAGAQSVDNSNPDVQALQAMPVNPQRSDQGNAALQQKMAMLANIQTPGDYDPSAAAAAKAQAAKAGFNGVPWAASGRAEERTWTPESGLFDEKDAPMPTAAFLSDNRWSGDVSGQHFDVYAGAAGTGRPGTGAVLVVTYDRAGQPGRPQVVTGQDVGPLHVVSVDGDRVRLQEDDGTTHELELGAGSLSLS